MPEWLQVKTTESILETLHVDLQERMNKFGRNFFTKEVEYLTAEDLRKEYIYLTEVLVRDLPMEDATKVLNELLKPSYLIQRKKFQPAEV